MEGMIPSVKSYLIAVLLIITFFWAVASHSHSDSEKCKDGEAKSVPAEQAEEKKSITILSSAEDKDLVDFYKGESDYSKRIDQIRPSCDGIGIIDSIEGSIVTIDAYVEEFCPVENEQEFFWRVGDTICGQELVTSLIMNSIKLYGIGRYEDHKECLYRHYARKFLH